MFYKSLRQISAKCGESLDSSLSGIGAYRIPPWLGVRFWFLADSVYALLTSDLSITEFRVPVPDPVRTSVGRGVL